MMSKGIAILIAIILGAFFIPSCLYGAYFFLRRDTLPQWPRIARMAMAAAMVWAALGYLGWILAGLIPALRIR